MANARKQLTCTLAWGQGRIGFRRQGAGQEGARTGLYVPADNEEVIRFFANLGKWFLHFSEPESILTAILPKKARNLDADCHTAVIYRRGVRGATRADYPYIRRRNKTNAEVRRTRILASPLDA